MALAELPRQAVLSGPFSIELPGRPACAASIDRGFRNLWRSVGRLPESSVVQVEVACGRSGHGPETAFREVDNPEVGGPEYCSASASGQVCITRLSLIIKDNYFSSAVRSQRVKGARPGCAQRRKNRKGCAFIADPLPRESAAHAGRRGKVGALSTALRRLVSLDQQKLQPPSFPFSVDEMESI